MSDGFSRLPAALRCDAVRPYCALLQKKRATLFVKRLFDVAVSAVMLALLSPLLLALAAAVRLGSPGPVFYRQVRVTRYAREFRIFKFRSMVAGADRAGPLVTVGDDPRITKVGAFLRRTRLDELPQLLNVLAGDMSFVGTRPEVPKYVAAYTDEMKATLLLRAGITSPASIAYIDEARLLDGAADPDRVYIGEILPAKMEYNLRYIRELGCLNDLKIMFRTVFAVAGE